MRINERPCYKNQQNLPKFISKFSPSQKLEKVPSILLTEIENALKLKNSDKDSAKDDIIKEIYRSGEQI